MWIRDWLENRRIRKMGVTVEQWESAVSDWPVAKRYQGSERDALREVALRFIARKAITAGGDFELLDAMVLKLATMACVPILKLGLDWYDHFQTVIVYRDDYVSDQPYRSDDGVVHSGMRGLSGEAWLRGPVILSWSSIRESGPHSRDGHASNVVIHELAHKLDMLRDGANGSPPMHPDMRPGEWHDIFSSAWNRLHDDDEHGRALPIDGYSLTNEAEFFAVCSESFFEAPENMKQKMPEVYRLLCQFYRQQPALAATASQ
ncbi:zinc-dependent peptidase [Dokdonella sp.]|uniref:M90 family metallopeptidase n=1 Tax=Dokdonella sp. TaxID=2291710 RepID=UPI003529AFEC